MTDPRKRIKITPKKKPLNIKVKEKDPEALNIRVREKKKPLDISVTPREREHYADPNDPDTIAFMKQVEDLRRRTGATHKTRMQPTVAQIQRWKRAQRGG